MGALGQSSDVGALCKDNDVGALCKDNDVGALNKDSNPLWCWMIKYVKCIQLLWYCHNLLRDCLASLETNVREIKMYLYFKCYAYFYVCRLPKENALKFKSFRPLIISRLKIELKISIWNFTIMHCTVLCLEVLKALQEPMEREMVRDGLPKREGGGGGCDCRGVRIWKAMNWMHQHSAIFYSRCEGLAGMFLSKDCLSRLKGRKQCQLGLQWKKTDGN